MKKGWNHRFLTFLILFFFFFAGTDQIAYAKKPTPPDPVAELILKSTPLVQDVPIGESVDFKVAVTYTGQAALQWTPSQHLTATTPPKINRTTYTAGFRFTAQTPGLFHETVTITDGSNTVVFHADFTVPGLPPEEPVDYLALGDSIPYGTYYSSLWDYLSDGTDTYSYAEQLADQMGILPEHFTDASISGYNADEVYIQLSGIETLIRETEIISLCVGGNDIMDAAARTLSGLDKHNIDWTAADAERDNFQSYWPRIIDRIENLNPEVTLLVMTVYNPYHTDDIYGGINYFDRVDPYFSAESGADPGINHLIRSMMALDNTGTYWTQDLIGDSFDYRVADVYQAFNSYGDGYDDKDALTGFYSSFCDPHPRQLGQNLIFSAHWALLQ